MSSPQEMTRNPHQETIALWCHSGYAERAPFSSVGSTDGSFGPPSEITVREFGTASFTVTHTSGRTYQVLVLQVSQPAGGGQDGAGHRDGDGAGSPVAG